MTAAHARGLAGFTHRIGRRQFASGILCRYRNLGLIRFSCFGRRFRTGFGGIRKIVRRGGACVSRRVRGGLRRGHGGGARPLCCGRGIRRTGIIFITAQAGAGGGMFECLGIFRGCSHAVAPVDVAARIATRDRYDDANRMPPDEDRRHEAAANRSARAPPRADTCNAGIPFSRVDRTVSSTERIKRMYDIRAGGADVRFRECLEYNPLRRPYPMFRCMRSESLVRRCTKDYTNDGSDRITRGGVDESAHAVIQCTLHHVQRPRI